MTHRTIEALLIATLLAKAAGPVHAQTADTVRLMPANILVTLPSAHAPTPSWTRRDSTLRDGRPVTFLQPGAQVQVERVAPRLLFFWLNEPDCNTWKRHLDRIKTAGTDEEIVARVADMRAENQRSLAQAGLTDSLSLSPSMEPASYRRVRQAPEDFLAGVQPFVVLGPEGAEWARNGWSDVYVLMEEWSVSCFDGARRPLAVVHTGTMPFKVGPWGRFNEYTRDVLNAVGRAARQQYPRR